MALFARRHLQRVLNENAAFVSPKQLSTICGLLNTVHDDYLATEWEQVIVNAASKVGVVQYEPRLPGNRAPDLQFQASEPPPQFIADVTTASDKGLRKLNPVDALHEEFSRHLRKRKLFMGGFDVQVDAYPNSVYRGSEERVRLKLPNRADFSDKIFSSGFLAFLRNVRTVPAQRHRFDVVTADTGVHFTYEPSRRGTSGGGHPSFTFASIIDQNPVYNALKAKGDQLKGVGYDGIKGIFLCDGGCEMLRSTLNNWASYSVDEIVREFFRHFDSVSFVATFIVREHSSGSFSDWRRLIEAKLHLNPKWKTDFAPLTQVLSRIHRLLPEAQYTPENAMHHLRSENGMFGRYFGKLITGGNMKMSLREFQELLAGVKTIEEFENEYSMAPQSNPFRTMLSQGRLISNVTVEHCPEKDDDTVTIEFGDADAAVGQYCLPVKST
jgi:hypothetical protein